MPNDDEIIGAYETHGSVWAAGIALDMSGQQVHRRLRRAGHRLNGQEWTAAEDERLRELAGRPIQEIAETLGRTYTAVAIRLSRAGLRTEYPRKRKLPRGAGYDKASTAKRREQIDAGAPLRRVAAGAGLTVDGLVRALQGHFPDWWEAHAASLGLQPKACPYCSRDFFPSNGKQVYCERRCAETARRDFDYFDGKRRQTIGLAAGQCQLCLRIEVKGLSAHHVLGKENDPDNEVLVALCPGCHQIVGWLAARKFVDQPERWEFLIQLVTMRRKGADPPTWMETYVEHELSWEPVTEEEG